MQGLAFDADAKRLFSSADDAEMRVWKINRTAPAAPWPELSKFKYPGKIIDLRFSRDGKRLAIGGTAKRIALWETTGNRPQLRWLDGHTVDVRQLEFLDGGRKLLSAAGGEWDPGLSGELKLWDLETRGPPRSIGSFEGTLASLAIGNDEAWVATGDWIPRPEIRLWDLASGNELPKHDFQRYGYLAGFDHGREQMIIAGGDGAYEWELPRDKAGLPTSGTAICKIFFAGMHLTPQGGEFSRDRSAIFCPTGRPSVVFDLKREKVLASVHGRTGAFSSGGRMLATSDEPIIANQISLWDLAHDRLIGTLRGVHGLKITRLAFCLDDRWILSANTDGTLHFWKVPQEAIRD